MELAARRRRQLIEKYQIKATIASAVLIWCLLFAVLMTGVHIEYQESKYHMESK